MKALLRKIWYAITLRCPTCGSPDHILHNVQAIPRAWLVDAMAMAPGPDTLYRGIHYGDGQVQFPYPPDPCQICGRDGHCPHKCQMIGWCHECDGDLCGGGCRNDKDCPKRIKVIESGRPGWELYPDEWIDKEEMR